MKQQVPYSSIARFVDAPAQPEELVERKQTLGMDILPDEERTVTAVISNPSVDGDGDIIVPEGIDTRTFETNPVVMWSHTYSKPPIGKVISLSKSPAGLVAKIKFAATEAADEVWKLVQGGFLKANSIGFVTRKAFVKGTAGFVECFKALGSKPPEECRRVIAECMLLENSLCAIPSNKDALIQSISAKSMSLSPKMAKELGLVEESDLARDVEDLRKSNEILQKTMHEFVESLKARVEVKETAPLPVAPVIPVVAPVAPVAPVVAPVEPPKPLWNVIRAGPAELSAQDRAEVDRLAAERKDLTDRRRRGQP